MLQRLMFVIVVTAGFHPASSEVCTKIADDRARLACFDATRRCAGIRSGSERLACFDTAYAVPGAAESTVDGGGTTDNATADPTPTVAVDATITDVKSSAFEIDYIWLDNGEVWRENEDTRVRFKRGQKVRIEPGILGSFTLTIEDSEKTIKVKRAQ